MKEVEAKDFDLSSIDNESTPASVRILEKSGENHLVEIPNDEVSFHISSILPVDIHAWDALAAACRDAGFNAEVTSAGKSVVVW